MLLSVLCLQRLDWGVGENVYPQACLERDGIEWWYTGIELDTWA